MRAVDEQAGRDEIRIVSHAQLTEQVVEQPASAVPVVHRIKPRGDPRRSAAHERAQEATYRPEPAPDVVAFRVERVVQIEQDGPAAGHPGRHGTSGQSSSAE